MTGATLPVVIAHDRAQCLAAARAAATLGLQVRVETPGALALALGPMWMRAFLDSLAAEGGIPAAEFAFGCGPHAGLAMAGLRLKLPGLRFEPAAGSPARLANVLAEIAARDRCALALGAPPADAFRFPPPAGPPDAAALLAAAAAGLAGFAERP